MKSRIANEVNGFRASFSPHFQPDVIGFVVCFSFFLSAELIGRADFVVHNLPFRSAVPPPLYRTAELSHRPPAPPNHTPNQHPTTPPPPTLPSPPHAHT